MTKYLVAFNTEDPHISELSGFERDGLPSEMYLDRDWEINGTGRTNIVGLETSGTFVSNGPFSMGGDIITWAEGPTEDIPVNGLTMVSVAGEKSLACRVPDGVVGQLMIIKMVEWEIEGDLQVLADFTYPMVAFDMASPNDYIYMVWTTGGWYPVSFQGRAT